MSIGALDKKMREKWSAFIQGLNTDIDPKTIRLMDEMRMVSHALYQLGENSLTAAGLSFAQYRILMGLMFAEEMQGREGLNPSEISKKQGTSRNTISALVRSLEEEGLIERRLDPKDLRKFNISLTATGRARVRDHVESHFRIIAGCFAGLTAEEQDILNQILTKLGGSIHAMREELLTTPTHAIGD